MNQRTAILLLAHGARDPEWARPMERLVAVVSGHANGVRVIASYLEFMTPGLPAAIEAAVQEGCSKIRVVPVFLAAGGHVKRDVPVMLQAAQVRHPDCTIELAGVLGEAESVIEAMAGEVLRGL